MTALTAYHLQGNGGTMTPVAAAFAARPIALNAFKMLGFVMTESNTTLCWTDEDPQPIG